MSESFDPYYHWLSIPPEERPPHAYRLLGLEKYESDRDVIASAADRQMSHVKAHASGPHGQSSQIILNELAKAKLTLIDPAKKAKYDELLRKNEQVRSTPVQEVAVNRAIPLDELAAEEQLAAPVALADPATRTLPRLAAKKKRTNVALIGHIIAPIVGIVLGCVVLSYILSLRGKDEPVVANDGDEAKRKVVQFQRTPRRKPRFSAIKPSEEKSKVAPKPKPVRVAPKPEPKPVKPADPFEQLGEILEIPSLAALDQVEIAKIAIPKDTDLKLSLVAAPIADAPELEFRLGEDRSIGALKQWDVLIAKLPEDAAGEVKTAKIGGLSFEENALSFYWTDVARQLPSGQFRNCMLTLDAGGYQIDVPLRKTVRVPPLKLELINTVERLSMTLTDQPDEAAVYFQILDNSVLKLDHEFEPADARAELGQRLTINLPQTEVRLRPYVRGDELTIETIGRYKIAGKEYPLTVERVNKQLTTFQKQLAENGNELLARQRQAVEFRARLSSLGSFRAADSAARKKLEAELIKVRNLAAKNARRMESLSESIPFLRTSIQQLPLIVNLGNTLQTSARLHYRIFVALDNREVDLVISDDTVEFLPGEEEESGDISDEELTEIQDSLARLEADPADAEANLIVGRHYCLRQNKWSKGMHFLAKCGDEKLAAAAQIDLENATEPLDMVTIADAWYALHDDAAYSDYLNRAVYWYRLAAPDVTGFVSVKVRERLKELEK